MQMVAKLEQGIPIPYSAFKLGCAGVLAGIRLLSGSSAEEETIQNNIDMTTKQLGVLVESIKSMEDTNSKKYKQSLEQNEKLIGQLDELSAILKEVEQRNSKLRKGGLGFMFSVDELRSVKSQSFSALMTYHASGMPRVELTTAEEAEAVGRFVAVVLSHSFDFADDLFTKEPARQIVAISRDLDTDVDRFITSLYKTGSSLSVSLTDSSSDSEIAAKLSAFGRKWRALSRRNEGPAEFTPLHDELRHMNLLARAGLAPEGFGSMYAYTFSGSARSIYSLWIQEGYAELRLAELETLNKFVTYSIPNRLLYDDLVRPSREQASEEAEALEAED